MAGSLLVGGTQNQDLQTWLRWISAKHSLRKSDKGLFLVKGELVKSGSYGWAINQKYIKTNIYNF